MEYGNDGGDVEMYVEDGTGTVAVAVISTIILAFGLWIIKKITQL